jgi:ribonuclease P protein subunit RPR2
MLRVARERISTLFVLAEVEASSDHLPLSDRYVALARRIGARYNVRLLPEYRELYCRGCSRFWVEGRTVRTRLRGGRRVRTCLVCGRVRRVSVRPHRTAIRSPPEGIAREPPRVESGLATAVLEEGGDEEPADDATEEE